jgi:DNA polymerase-4
VTDTILHADLDCFYAAVELLDDPTLRGKPVVVGGPSDSRGVVASCNYEARRSGVRSAMPMAEAMRRCPRAVRRPPRFERYQALSEQVFAILGDFSPEIEPLSLDEAFIDVTGSERLLGDGETIARNLRARVRADTGLTISVGVAACRHVAKIASDLSKPDGLLVVPRDVRALREFLAPLPIERLPGVGPVTAPRLRGFGWTTFGELVRADARDVEDRLGAGGLAWQQMARGEEPPSGRVGRRSRSISHETTFARDVIDREQLRRTVGQLTDEVGARARRDAFSGRTVQVKVRFPDFTTITRSRTLAEPTQATEAIFQLAWALIEEHVPRRAAVRLIGVGLHQDGPARPAQRLLFEEGPGGESLAPTRGDPGRLDKAMDAIRARLGQDAIRRARDIEPE